MKFITILFFVLFNINSYAQTAVAEIAVGNAELDKDKFVIDDPEQKSLSGDQKSMASEITENLRNNFSFYRHKFNNIDYSDKGEGSYSSPKFEKWQSEGITYFVSSEALSRGIGNNAGIEMNYKVFNVLGKKEIFKESFKVDQKNLRQMSLNISNKIYRSITGKDSVFNSKIVFISDRTTRSGRDIEKELYIMDFDGRRVEKLTDFNSVVLSPSVAPDNSKIMFSLFASHRVKADGKVRMIKNIDLKSYDLKTKKFSTLSQKPGINSGAIFSSDPNIIYLTLSYTGNADIYEMNLSSGAMRKVTSHYADDVDPSITSDGSLMSFLSTRPGRAHIYVMDPKGVEKDIKRISFVGQFNATPRFSPDGKEIVFTSWVDNGFDLYRVAIDGNNLVRLTKNFGSNEEPVYSPDGEFIVFTSKRSVSRHEARQDVYIMNREGEILGQLTQDFGHCFSPQWTNILK